jgi:hypothetical protein
MKEKPIIFSTEMVKAILAGNKSMTRRVIKPQPIMHDFESHKALAFKEPFTKPGYIAVGVDRVKECPSYLRCPYGQVGDILWVRETWAIHDLILKPKKLNPNDEAWFYKRKFSPEMVPHIVYAADYPVGSWKGAWRSPRFMPKIAARLFLKVKDIRVERLQDITEEDAIAEGVAWKRAADINALENSESVIDRAKVLFMRLWDTLNAKRGYGWDLNPFVWVVEFERAEGK